jgi:cAMP-dependent protein kinase regulator
MTIDRLATDRAAAVERLMTSGRYAEALTILREELARRPDDARVMMQLADGYALIGHRVLAIRILRHLADRLAAHGFPGKAITALKKIQRIDPSEPDISDSIVALIEKQRTGDPGAVQQPLELPADVEADFGATRETPIPEHLLHHEAFIGAPMRAVDDTTLDESIPSPLFDDFSRDELLVLMRGLELQVFDPGDLIVVQGDAGDSLFIITSGIVKAFVNDGKKRHRQVRTLHEGDFFGEISILQGGRRSATITAATHCELLELDRDALAAIRATHPRVGDVLQRYHDERVASDQSLA